MCRISKDKVDSYFQDLLGAHNDNIRAEYENPDPEVQEGIDSSFNPAVTPTEALHYLSSMNYDSAAGSDKVSIKILRDVDQQGEIMAAIWTVCLPNARLPNSMKEARTVLLPKSGDLDELASWRGISICSAIRRCVSKVVNARLEQYVELSEHQKGFYRLPGLLENVNRLEGILKASKESHRKVCVWFLDISKAFDNVCHKHIERTLPLYAIPEHLRKTGISFYEDASTTIECSNGRTDAVTVRRGVLQGDPLSPLLFNICNDFVLQDLNRECIRSKYGFTVNGDLALTVFAFADDLVIVTCDRKSMEIISSDIVNKLRSIGLAVNQKKSKFLETDGKGYVSEELLDVPDCGQIAALSATEKVEYLGVVQHNLQFNLGEEIWFFHQTG